MLRSVLGKSLWDQRGPLAWWGLGTVALFIVTILFYPSVRSASGLDEMMKQLPEALLKMFVGETMDLASPEGYLNSQLFQMLFPLIVLFYVIRSGSSATAGEEERGTIDLLLSCPLPRGRLVLEKAIAMVAGTAALTAITWLGLWAGVAMVGMEISPLRTAAAVFMGLLLGLVFGAFAMVVGAATGSRGMAVGIPAAVGVAAYFVNALAPLAKGLEPFRKLSPFYYYMGTDPLSNGIDITHALVLLALVIVLLGIALAAFERRDVAV